MSAVAPEQRRLAVRITADALRQVRRGHPWVYAGSVVAAPVDGRPGDLAVVFDDRRRFAAIGLWDPTSPLRLRVLHHGSPMAIDAAFWRSRLGDALERRAGLAADGRTTGYRAVHGEGDRLPGLVLDRYGATWVLKLYTAAWAPLLRVLVELIEELADPDVLVLRLSREVQRLGVPGLEEGRVLLGPRPDAPVPFLELGLQLEADVLAGQKTGHFLDQRDNRARVGALSGGADVLDVFSCTGGFSLAAAAGGARRVVSVDRSPGALATGRANLARNRHLPAVAAARHGDVEGDAFEVLADLARRREAFDVVVIDPPSFAKDRAGVDRALAAYRRLTRLGLAVLRPGGALVQASCSSRVAPDAFVDVVTSTAARAGRPLRQLQVTGHAVDHPVAVPEHQYLKAVLGRA